MAALEALIPSSQMAPAVSGSVAASKLSSEFKFTPFTTPTSAASTPQPSSQATAAPPAESGTTSGRRAPNPLERIPLQQTDPAILARLQELPKIVAEVMGADEKTHLEAITQFRKLLSIERNPPIQAVIDTGVVPRFVKFLENDQNPPLQFEAAWALTNIASGTSDHTHVVIKSGVIPIFVRLLMSPNDDVREQAVWALGNIAGDSPVCRNQVLEAGAMRSLLQQLTENSKLSMLRNGTWALSNFCRGKPQPDFNLVRPALSTLAQLIYSTDDDVLTDACWALSYLSDGPNDKIQAVIETGVCRRLVELLCHQSPSVQTPVLRTVGNIATGDELQTQIIINFSALPCLHTLLNSPKKGIRKEACWTISNITAGNRDQIQAVIEANIIPPLINLLKTDEEFDVKKEAAWAISNATSGGTPEQIKLLVNQGCMGPLSDLLGAQDPKIVNVVLEGLENILKVGEKDAEEASGEANKMAQYIHEVDGFSKIEKLQQHTIEGIRNKAVKVMEFHRFVIEHKLRDRAASSVERIVRGKQVRARVTTWHGKARILQRVFALARKRSAAAAKIQVLARIGQRRSAATKIQARLRGLLVSRPERLKKQRHREAENAAAVAEMRGVFEEHKCPITLTIPAPDDRLFCVVDGETYQATSIMQWITNHRSSPTTREPVELMDLVTIRESKLLTRPRTAQIIPATLKALKAVGFDAAKAKHQGFDAAQCKAGGYDALELKNGGFGLETLKALAGFSAKNCADANFSLRELKVGGFSALELKNTRKFSLEQFVGAGFSADELFLAGFTAAESVEAGIGITAAAAAFTIDVDALAAELVDNTKRLRAELARESGSNNEDIENAAAGGGGPLKKDGTPDMRFKANRIGHRNGRSSGVWPHPSSGGNSG